MTHGENVQLQMSLMTYSALLGSSSKIPNDFNESKVQKCFKVEIYRIQDILNASRPSVESLP